MEKGISIIQNCNFINFFLSNASCTHVALIWTIYKGCMGATESNFETDRIPGPHFNFI